MGGRGPTAWDGENGPLYHYLKIEVTPDAIRVSPIGVRRLEEGYRREEPMPVYYVPSLAEKRPAWQVQSLKTVVVRRNLPPQALWE